MVTKLYVSEPITNPTMMAEGTSSIICGGKKLGRSWRLSIVKPMSQTITIEPGQRICFQSTPFFLYRTRDEHCLGTVFVDGIYQGEGSELSYQVLYKRFPSAVEF